MTTCGVEMRIAGPRHLVDVGSAGETLGRDHVDAVTPPAREALVTLEVVEAGADAAVVGGEDGRLHTLIAHGEEHTHRLGRREGEVKSGIARPPSAAAGKRVAGER